MLAKDEIKARVSLGEIVQRDLGSPVRRSGHWLIYFCPFHENTRTPALGVNLETDTFKCFSCMVQGDLFTWRMLRARESFPDALRYFREMVAKQGHSSPATGKDHPKNLIYEPPSRQWQQRGWAFLQYAQQQLWQNEAGLQFGLDELFRRGLRAPTILTWGLGYNPTWICDSPVRWGLHHQGRDHKVKLGRGLVIPCKNAGTLWYLKIRVFDNQGKPVDGKSGCGKYLQPSGGKGTLFGGDHFTGKATLLLAESEFDALLAWQEAGDWVDVATLGGAGKNLKTAWIPQLLSYRRILVAYDLDAPGQQGANKLAHLSDRLEVCPPPLGDLCDFQMQGGGMRSWVEGLLKE